MARKAISQKARFEVFKRDSFTCQYCGASAPDVILNVDHIDPVAKGGRNDILNLITSCFSCNSGKSDRKLDDQTVVKKQIDQLKDLNERKNQIEMIAQWKSGLAQLEDSKLEAVRQAINLHLSKGKQQITDSYLRTEIKTALRKYGLEEILDSVEKSASTYLFDAKNSDQCNNFLAKIPRIAYWSDHEKKNPEIARLRKIAYYANKHWYRCNPQTLTTRLIRLNREFNLSPDELYAAVSDSTGIMQFEDNIRSMTEESDLTYGQ